MGRNVKRRSRPWWLGPLGLAVILVVVRVVYIAVAAGESGEAARGTAMSVLLLLGVTVLVVWVPLGVAAAQGKGRDRFVSAASPKAVLVLGSRTEELRWTVGRLRSGVSVFFLCSVDEQGVHLWQGGRRPERVLDVDWSQIAEITAIDIASDTGRPFTALCFGLGSADEQKLRLVFLVRNPRNRLFPLDRRGVEDVAASIRQKDPHLSR